MRSWLPDGRNLLQELSQHKHVAFRLHELGGVDSKGSGEEFYYRTENIVFREIDVMFSEETLKQ